METIPIAVVFALAAYLYGSVPYAYIAARLLRGTHLDHEGTGNIGVTNAFKAGGYAVGTIAVAGEISKGLVPVGMAQLFFDGSRYSALLFLVCSLTGTSFSIFLKGRGGKGATLTGWGLFLLSPYACLMLISLYVVAVKAAGRYPVAKAVLLPLIPGVLYLVERDLVFAFFGFLISVVFVANRINRKDDFRYYGVYYKNNTDEAARSCSASCGEDEKSCTQ